MAGSISLLLLRNLRPATAGGRPDGDRSLVPRTNNVPFQARDAESGLGYVITSASPNVVDGLLIGLFLDSN